MLPEIVASPATMTAKSSARGMVASQERISSGASTLPTKTLAATEKPQAPEMPKARRSSTESPRTTSGRMRQW